MGSSILLTRSDANTLLGPRREDGVIELLLLSNSTNFGGTMLAHAGPDFVEVAAGSRVTFVPFALADWDGYAKRAEDAFGALGIEVESAHRCAEPDRAILDAEVIMIGGGNSFRLLESLQCLDVLDQLGANVRAGTTRYMGASAGTNLACPSIRTTNDMPIAVPPTLSALGLVPFQINSHYVDTDDRSQYTGETREERVLEFLEENDCPVLALYEGSWLRVSGPIARLTGPARLFERSGATSLNGDLDVSHLLESEPRFGVGRRPVAGEVQ